MAFSEEIEASFTWAPAPSFSPETEASFDFTPGHAFGEETEATFLWPVEIQPTSIPGEESWGTPTITVNQTVFPPSIPTQESWGTLTITVQPSPADAQPTTFAVRRGYEGPQVIVEWNDPVSAVGVTAVRLVRRLYGYPVNSTDGDLIFSGAPGARLVADLTVLAKVCYYYKLYTTLADGTIISTAFHQGHVIALETGFFAQKLWEILPEHYKRTDKKRDQADNGRLALTEGPGSTDEVFNFGEDGSEQKGQLRRFLKLFGPMLDEAKGLLDTLLSQLDVDDVCLSNLVHLAKLLGLDLNTELSPEKTRNEVRLQVEFLKKKGTIPGLQARLRSVSGITARIREQCHNVFYTNDLESLTAQFTPLERDGLGGPDDELHYVTGYDDVQPFWLWFTVFMDLAVGQGTSEVLLRKWCQAIDESSPTCHRGFLALRSLDEDTIGVVITDESEDIAETADVDPLTVSIVDVASDELVADAARWLIFNDTSKTLNASNWTAVFAEESTP